MLEWRVEPIGNGVQYRIAAEEKAMYVLLKNFAQIDYKTKTIQPYTIQVNCSGSKGVNQRVMRL